MAYDQSSGSILLRSFLLTLHNTRIPKSSKFDNFGILVNDKDISWSSLAVSILDSSSDFVVSGGSNPATSLTEYGKICVLEPFCLVTDCLASVNLARLIDS